MKAAGLGAEFRYGTRTGRRRSLFCAPSTCCRCRARMPSEGLYLLEAMANGCLGAAPTARLPEMLDKTGEAALRAPRCAEPGRAAPLLALRASGRSGPLRRQGVARHYTQARMAERTLEVFASITHPRTQSASLSSLGSRGAPNQGRRQELRHAARPPILEGVSSPWRLASRCASWALGQRQEHDPEHPGRPRASFREPCPSSARTRSSWPSPRSAPSATRWASTFKTISSAVLRSRERRAHPRRPRQKDATRGRAQARARELLSRVGLAERLDHRPAELSGGERAPALARALCSRPAAPLRRAHGNLDAASAASVADLLFELHARSRPSSCS
jgi:ABC-type dipeptide/oligopeptide/nickel transport system ATPase subunit